MSQINIQNYCQQNEIKLTPLRSNVLNILAKQTRPITAYEILELLKQINPKAQVMSVYRILEFLQDNGLVHRIENLNAFMLCHHLAENNACTSHVSQWLICEKCGVTIETTNDKLNHLLEEIARDNQFTITTPTIELIGLCEICQKKE